MTCALSNHLSDECAALWWTAKRVLELPPLPLVAANSKSSASNYNAGSSCIGGASSSSSSNGSACAQRPQVADASAFGSPSLLHDWAAEESPELGNSREVLGALERAAHAVGSAVERWRAGLGPGQKRRAPPMLTGGGGGALAAQQQQQCVPLSWREFHRVGAAHAPAAGSEGYDAETSRSAQEVAGSSAPQPIPMLLLAHDRESVAVSPFALRYWVCTRIL